MSAAPKKLAAWVATLGCLLSTSSNIQAQTAPGPSPADEDASPAIVESAPIDTYPYTPVDAARSSEPLWQIGRAHV